MILDHARSRWEDSRKRQEEATDCRAKLFSDDPRDPSTKSSEEKSCSIFSCSRLFEGTEIESNLHYANLVSSQSAEKLTANHTGMAKMDTVKAFA